MLKKLTFVLAPLAPLAVVMAMATAPTPASADYICQSGTPTHPTPNCFYYCRVPSVVGLKLHLNAIPLIHSHNCRAKTHFKRKHKHGLKFRRWVVYKQAVPPKTAEPYNFVLNIWAKAQYFHKKK